MSNDQSLQEQINDLLSYIEDLGKEIDDQNAQIKDLQEMVDEHETRLYAHQKFAEAVDDAITNSEICEIPDTVKKSEDNN